MIKLMSDLPNGVIGVKVNGEITAEDYKKVLDPALEKARDINGKVSVLMSIGEDGVDYTGGAMWQDMKLGLKHPLSFHRVAVVGEKRFRDHFAPVVSALMPGTFRVFDPGQQDAALAWVTESTGS